MTTDLRAGLQMNGGRLAQAWRARGTITTWALLCNQAACLIAGTWIGLFATGRVGMGGTAFLCTLAIVLALVSRRGVKSVNAGAA